MTPGFEPPRSEKPSAMPVVAVVFAILSFCIPCFIPVAIILAIVSLVKSSEPRFSERKALAIIALILPLVAVPVFGILAAIAIPNFIKFQSRSKQSECKMNLKMAYAAARAAEVEGTLNDDFASIGFAPGSPRRYLYTFGPSAQIAPDATDVSSIELFGALPQDLLADLGVHDGHFTIACVGNTDNDSNVDVQSVSSVDRTVNGEKVRAGEVAHHLDDSRD